MNTMTGPTQFYLQVPDLALPGLVMADSDKPAASDENGTDSTQPAVEEGAGQLIPGNLAPAPLAAGTAQPRYLPAYCGWQTELGLVPDPGQHYQIVAYSLAAEQVSTPPAPSPPPNITRAAFFELFTLEEEVQMRTLAASWPEWALLLQRLALADSVHLAAYRDLLAQLVDRLACISAEHKAARLEKILAGLAWWA